VSEVSPRSTPPWYRRRAALVGAAVAVVLAITVLSDLPVPTSRSADIASERSVMSELNSDLAPCALAVHEALSVWGDVEAHTLSSADRATSTALLRDDQNACSFTNETIFNLSNIEVPGSSAGRAMGDLVATATLWTTADALRAIEDVQTLMANAQNTTARRDLGQAERALAADRRTAQAEVRKAETILRTTLPQPDMPAMPLPSAT